jgi:hypothetical protein
MRKQKRSSDLDYHLQRARSERDIAYRAGAGPAAGAHMRLAALHLHRALLLQALRNGPVGNVHPFKHGPAGAPSPAPPLVELPSVG